MSQVPGSNPTQGDVERCLMPDTKETKFLVSLHNKTQLAPILGYGCFVPAPDLYHCKVCELVFERE